MKVYTLRPWLFQRGRFDNHTTREKVNLLLLHHIAVVVNMTARRDPALTIREQAGKLTYKVLEQPDSANFDWERMEIAVREVAGTLRLNKGFAALVHCNGGRNRASLFSARLLMELEGLTGRAAVKELRRLRPNALSNPHFVKYLENFK